MPKSAGYKKFLEDNAKAKEKFEATYWPGDEILARNALGHLKNVYVVRRTPHGLELAVNKHSLPIWATSYHGILKPIDRV